MLIKLGYTRKSQLQKRKEYYEKNEKKGQNFDEKERQTWVQSRNVYPFRGTTRCLSPSWGIPYPPCKVRNAGAPATSSALASRFPLFVLSNASNVKRRLPPPPPPRLLLLRHSPRRPRPRHRPRRRRHLLKPGLCSRVDDLLAMHTKQQRVIYTSGMGLIQTDNTPEARARHL